ncbi:BOI2 Protein BOI2 [Candida maltosa Xu316]
MMAPKSTEESTDKPKETSNNNNNNNAPMISNKKASIISLQQQQQQNQQSQHQQHSKTLSVQSLTDDLNPLHAYNWTPKQVSSYFALVLGFDMEVAGKFAKHKITGPILFELDLAHLKELDIDSFGTRFEIHKEIDKLKDIYTRNAKLKQQSRTNSQSTDSTNKNDTNASSFNSPPTASTTLPDNVPQFDDKQNEQTRLMPSAVLNDTSVYNKHHQRKRSQSLDNLSQPFIPSDAPFSSPRKAPQPPQPDSPMNTNYRFGAGSEYGQPPSHYGLYMTRTNASSQALNTLSRPASSIYDQFSSHNRSESQTSNRHKRNSSSVNHHRRHSSMLSFLSSGNDDSSKPTPQLQLSNGKFANFSNGNKFDDSLISPAQIKRETYGSQGSPVSLTGRRKSQLYDLSSSPVDIDDVNLSPKKSNSITGRTTKSMDMLRDEKRSTSDSAALTQSRPGTSRLKSLRTTSTQNFRNLTGSKKSKTSAFQEGIREITPDEAIKSANYSGYMSKRSNNGLSWRTRYFTLHGTRLSYFHSLKDKKEKGLIDITAHKVIPINSEGEETDKADKYAARLASTTFSGNYCFKIVPPAPGFKKGLTFTQPKTHYFAVESEEDMRGWVKALMQATIDIDDSVPVVSSCSTPTVSLNKAQELLAKAREETKLRDEELRLYGHIRGDDFQPTHNDTSFQSSNYSSSRDSNTLTETTEVPKLSIDTNVTGKGSSLTPSTPSIPRNSSQSGFVSPYLLASGLLSPRSGSATSPSATPNTTNSAYFGDTSYSSFKPPSRQSSGTTTNGNGNTNDSRKNSQYSNINNGSSGNNSANGNTNGNGFSSTPYSTASGSSSSSFNVNMSTPKEEPTTVFANSTGRVISGSKKQEKMLAFSSDGTGNHSFVIKAKK